MTLVHENSSIAFAARGEIRRSGKTSDCAPLLLEFRLREKYLAGGFDHTVSVRQAAVRAAVPGYAARGVIQI
jgi:hypothetical protein